MKHADVLIVSDEPEFARTIVDRWCRELLAPALTVAGSGTWNSQGPQGYDLIIAGGLRGPASHSTLCSLNERAHAAVLYLAETEDRSYLQNQRSHLLVLPRQGQWIDALMLVSAEILRRTEAVRRAQRAEQFAAKVQRYAALGRYMLQMRPPINDTLTSALGNADLLLAGDFPYSCESRQQIQTIQSMMLRLNEVMARFSSLDNEMRTFEKRIDQPEAAAAESSRLENLPGH
jgi:hypothetical protein